MLSSRSENFQKLGKVQKLQQLSGSCQEGSPEGSSRAGEGEGPEAGRKSAGRFTDVEISVPIIVRFHSHLPSALPFYCRDAQLPHDVTRNKFGQHGHCTLARSTRDTP